MANPAMLLPPGFRFHPTDEELILHYLRNRAASLPCPVSIIAEVDIYKLDPWELPAKAMFGDREWYFFSPRDRKYPNGYRPNRAAASGYWKATGTDKPILAGKGSGASIGVKKALVFYQGRPPRGVKTEWIMHEYRLAEAEHKNDYKPKKLRDSSMRLDDWVLCRIYKKGNNQSSTDAEKEDSASGVEDAFMSTPPSSNTQADNLLKLPKSYSLTELLDAADYSTLSRLLEHPPEALDLESNLLGFPTFNQSFISTNCLVQPQAEPPALKTENNLKRQWTGNECFEPGSGILPAAKRATGSRLATNLMNQPLINQQLISNSHLYFQYPT